MHKLFGDESEDEMEDQGNGGGEVIGVNGNNRCAGDEAYQNHNCRRHLPAPAASKHAYKSNSCRCGHRLEEGNAERQGSAGLAHHVVLGYQNMQGNVEAMNSEEEGYCQRIETNRTRFTASEFDGSKETYNADEDGVNRKRKPGPAEDDKAHGVLRDAFGASDEGEIAPYGGQDDAKNDNILPTEDEGHYGNILQGKDMVPGKNTGYESDANVERESKQCPVDPPLHLVVPHIPPPGQPNRMNVIKVSNIVGIDPKPFNPETYDEDAFESEGKKIIHLNVVRWRMAKNADGTETFYTLPNLPCQIVSFLDLSLKCMCFMYFPVVQPESNARFVKWKDGSMQLLIGDEALDVTVDESSHDTHLFMKNGQGLLQSQGRLLQKMRCMPSSLSSRSHRSLTALVDSQNKKRIKVQTWNNSIASHGFHKNEASGFKYNPHGRVAHGGFEHDLELGALAERRMFNAKVHEYSDSEREELEYETEIEDIESSPTYGRENELDENNGYDQDPEEDLGFTSVR
ncbi:hypothetical protein ACQ4PT_001556 [Festuca glaucescens]